MNVLIVGYGNMGREIEKILIERGHSIAGRVDPVAPDADAKRVTSEVLQSTETAIEFSLAEAVYDNARVYAEHAVKAVVGTTGWHDRLEEVTALFNQKGTYIHGTNFSIGAHIFFDLVEKASAAVSALPQYDLMMYEIHHSRKKDSPSGTALTTAERIIKAHAGKDRIVTDRLDRRLEDNELHVASVRGGSIPGIHTVLMDSPADTIEIRHTARNRTGFALGAVLAAEWIQHRTGFFTIEDFISDILDEGDTS